MTERQWDAILIPGGGLLADGNVPPWVVARLDRAMEQHTGELLITLSAGTVHKPLPRDAAGFPLFEAVAGARYLLERGIPRHLILTETASYDTIGNAYFALTIHTDPRRLRRLHVITSNFHLPRTEAIFRWVFGLAPSGYALTFEGVADAGIATEALAARYRKEQAALARLRPLMSTIGTLQELHAWLFSQHAAYAVGLQPSPQAETAVMDTY